MAVRSQLSTATVRCRSLPYLLTFSLYFSLFIEHFFPVYLLACGNVSSLPLALPSNQTSCEW